MPESAQDGEIDEDIQAEAFPPKLQQDDSIPHHAPQS
jgi:hypothetical protein